eukprot:scaffold4.g4846.t1
MAATTMSSRLMAAPLAARKAQPVRASKSAMRINAAARTESELTPGQKYALTLPGISDPFPNMFDPLGFTKTAKPADIKRWRESEILHSRVAMLAALGFIVGEQLEDFPAFLNFDGSITGPAIYQFQQVEVSRPLFWETLVLIIGLTESYRVAVGWASPIGGTGFNKLKEEYEPGTLGFDPLGLLPSELEELKVLQTKELNNGRLAMLSIAGFVLQELVPPHRERAAAGSEAEGGGVCGVRCWRHLAARRWRPALDGGANTRCVTAQARSSGCQELSRPGLLGSARRPKSRKFSMKRGGPSPVPRLSLGAVGAGGPPVPVSAGPNPAPLAVSLLSPAFELAAPPQQQQQHAWSDECAARFGVEEPERLRFFALTEARSPAELPQGCRHVAVAVTDSREWWNGDHLHCAGARDQPCDAHGEGFSLDVMEEVMVELQRLRLENAKLRQQLRGTEGRLRQSEALRHKAHDSLLMLQAEFQALGAELCSGEAVAAAAVVPPASRCGPAGSPAAVTEGRMEVA